MNVAIWISNAVRFVCAATWWMYILLKVRTWRYAFIYLMMKLNDWICLTRFQAACTNELGVLPCFRAVIMLHHVIRFYALANPSNKNCENALIFIPKKIVLWNNNALNNARDLIWKCCTKWDFAKGLKITAVIFRAKKRANHRQL